MGYFNVFLCRISFAKLKPQYRGPRMKKKPKFHLILIEWDNKGKYFYFAKKDKAYVNITITKDRQQSIKGIEVDK